MPDVAGRIDERRCAPRAVLRTGHRLASMRELPTSERSATTRLCSRAESAGCREIHACACFFVTTTAPMLRYVVDHVYDQRRDAGSANTKRLLPVPGRSSGVSAFKPATVSAGPVLTA